MIDDSEKTVVNGKEMFKAILDQLEKVHSSGFIYGDITIQDFVKDENGKWSITRDKPLYKQGTHLNTQNEYLGWKKQSRSPEYRNACLQGTEYYPTEAGDIYSFVYSLFEAVSGVRPRLNFQMERNWASGIEDSFGCDTERKKESLQRLLSKCMQISAYHRIQSCQQLKEMEEYSLLFLDEEEQ